MYAFHKKYLNDIWTDERYKTRTLKHVWTTDIIKLFEGFIFVKIWLVCLHMEKGSQIIFCALILEHKNLAVGCKRKDLCVQSISQNTNMAIFLEYFVRTFIILLLDITLCMATFRSVTTNFTEKKMVTTSHTTLQPFSIIQCVDLCYKEKEKGMCTLAGYNKTSETCYLSVDNPQHAVDTTDVMSGVFFYEPLLTGIHYI